jgi:lysylphosphatidylglycerol synthetase-like protein (DUF2156 family)
MASRRVDRGIDDALLAIASWASFVYARRRIRRFLSRLTVAAVVAASAAAVVTLGAALAWKRSRSKAAAPPNA